MSGLHPGVAFVTLNYVNYVKVISKLDAVWLSHLPGTEAVFWGKVHWSLGPEVWPWRGVFYVFCDKRFFCFFFSGKKCDEESCFCAGYMKKKVEKMWPSSVRTEWRMLVVTLRCLHPTVAMVTHSGRREGVRERRLHDDGKQVCQCDLHTGETLAGLRERNHTHTYTHTHTHTQTHSGQDRWRMHSEHLNPQTLCIRMKSGKSASL